MIGFAFIGDYGPGERSGISPDHEDAIFERYRMSTVRYFEGHAVTLHEWLDLLFLWPSHLGGKLAQLDLKNRAHRLETACETFLGAKPW